MFPIENSRGETLLPYNWKVVHDIDNEGYHVTHWTPFAAQLYGKNYKDTTVAGIQCRLQKLNDKPASLWSVRNYQNLLPKYDHLPEENQRLWLYGTIFPSMVIGLYPDSIEYYMTIPVATDKTLLRFGSYALPDAKP